MNNQDPQAGGQETAGTIGTWRVTYVPGPWVALAGPDALVVMPPAPARAERFLTRLWESVVPTASVDDLVAELGRAGVTEMPDMAALFWDSGSMHSLVRGRLRILDAASGEVIAAGEGVRTWSETGLGDVRAVVIAPADEPRTSDDVLHLPLVVGAASVGSLVVETSPDRLVRCPAAAPRTAVVEPPALAEAREEAGRGPAAAPGPDRGLLTGTAGAAVAGAAAAGAVGGAAATGPEQEGPHMGAVEAVAQGGGDAPHGQVYDPVHPETDEPRTAEIEAVPEPWDDRSGQGGTEPEGPGADAATQMMDMSGEPEHAPEAEPEPEQQATEPEPEPPSEPERPAESERPAEHGPAPWEAERPAQGPAGTAVLTPPPGPAGATAPAGPSGVSGTGTVGGEGRAPEPPSVMALLRPITGAPVLVDRPVLVGRAPNAQKAGLSVTPKLMTVPSPSHDISRTHLKVEPVGRTVQVTDLHSTNGTVLITGPVGGDPSLAGQRHQLVPGEPVAVQPGWILDLGDGVTILIDRA